MQSTWFSDPEDTSPSFIRLTRNILIVTIVANFAILLFVMGLFIRGAQNTISSIALATTLVLELVSLAFTLRGYLLPAKIIVPIALLIAVTYSAINANGLHDISVLGFPVVIVLSVLLLRKRSINIITPLAVLCVEAVAFADILGLTKSEMASKTDISDAAISAILIISVSILLQFLVSRLSESAGEARRNETAQIEANQELLALRDTLEKRILDRTKELTETIKISDRRAANFEAAAELARTVANVREINQLLPTIANVIGEKFNYYHVGVFLNDNQQEYTNLVASNSERGQKLLEQGYQVKIAQSGLVPSAAKSGELRMTSERSQVTTQYSDPELSSTHSELVLPLKVANSILGVIDIHSQAENAFDDTAIGILSILADQVAIAVQNARTYNDTQTALAESQILYGNVIQQSWKTQVQAVTHLGYRYSGTSLTTLEKPLTSIETIRALESGQVVSSPADSKTGGNTIAVPLKLRGDVIGVINVKMPPELDFGTDETDIVRAAADRVALALENSTLLEDSQRRASREQTIGQISAKIGAGTEIETILKTAVRELGIQISGAQVSVEIGSDND